MQAKIADDANDNADNPAERGRLAGRVDGPLGPRNKFEKFSRSFYSTISCLG